MYFLQKLPDKQDKVFKKASRKRGAFFMTLKSHKNTIIEPLFKKESETKS